MTEALPGPGPRARDVRIRLLALGFLTSGILITPSLPIVGTKLALPDIPLVLFVLLALMGTSRCQLRPGAPAYGLVLIGAVFIYHATLSGLLSAMQSPEPLLIVVTILNYLYGFLIFACVALTVRSYDDLDYLLEAWLAGGFIVAAVALWGVLGDAPDWASDGKRIKSTLRSVNQMQSYLAPVLLIACFYLFIREKSRLLKFGLFLLIPMCLIALLVTGSRSSVLFLVLVALGVLTYALRNLRRHKLLAPILVSVFAGFGVLLFAVVAAVMESGADVLPEGAQAVARPIKLYQEMLILGEGDEALEALGPRGEQFEIIFSHWHERLFFGVGPSNFRAFFDHRHEVHNTYLGVLIEHGLAGLILLVSFIGGVALSLFRTPASAEAKTNVIRAVLIAVLAVVCAYGITNFGLRQRVFWLTMGLSVALVRLMLEEERLHKRPRMRSGQYADTSRASV